MTIVGYCPKCGAPIYAPTVWHGITPPPNTYTCNCVPHNTQNYTTSTTSTTGEVTPGMVLKEKME